MQYVIITGMSGAGKSTALKYMEDMGYFCVDNLPLQLLDKLFALTDSEDAQHPKIALGIDIRTGNALDVVADELRCRKEKGINIQTVFLEASDEVLLKRYKETRRNHPLAGMDRLELGIQRERSLVKVLKEHADYIIDTSNLLTREFKDALNQIFLMDQQYDNLFLSVLSFGFKYGIPADADLVFDVRFLPNPYYLEELRPKTGNDPEIRDFVMNCPQAGEFLDKLEDMIRFLIPNYISEGKSRLVLAIGCTGGKHRSVTLANAISQRLQRARSYGLRVEHRDLEKDAKRGK